MMDLVPFCNSEEQYAEQGESEYPIEKWVVPEEAFDESHRHASELAREVNRYVFEDHRKDPKKAFADRKSRLLDIFEKALVQFDREVFFGKGKKRYDVMLKLDSSDPSEKRSTCSRSCTSDGEKVALPFHEGLGIDARKSYDFGEEDSIEIETLIDPAKGQDESAMFPVMLRLTLGGEYLEVSFTSIATGLVDLLFHPKGRARVGELLDDGKGIAAVSMAMGEWRTYARDERADEVLEVPEERSRDEADVDGFGAFLVERLRSDA